MKSLLSIFVALAALPGAAHSQAPDAMAKAPAAASTRTLELKLFVIDTHGTQVVAGGVQVHLSGAKLPGDGNYLTDNKTGELRLSLLPGDYTLDVLGPTMCFFPVTIKAGQDAALGLLIPPQSNQKCAFAKDAALSGFRHGDTSRSPA